MKLLLCLWLVFLPIYSLASPNIELALEKQQLAQLIKAGDWKAMQAKVDDMRSRGVDLGTSIIFFEGRGAFELNEFDVANTKLRRYIEVSNGKGPFYVQALSYLGQIQQKEEAAKRAELARQAAEAARMAAIRARNEWLEHGMIGKVTEVNVDWGYIKLSIDQPDKINEPIQLKQGAGLVALGKLNKVDNTTYTATVKDGIEKVSVGDTVYPCCSP